MLVLHGTQIYYKNSKSCCIIFCVKVDETYLISEWEFKYLNWLPLNKRCEQSVNTAVFKFVARSCPYYLNEVFEFAPEYCIKQRNVFFKLENPFQNKNKDRKALSFISPSPWN